MALRATSLSTHINIKQNNAGVLLDFDIATLGLRKVFEKAYAVNVFGAAVTAEAFLPLLKKSTAHDGPKILNISSSLGSMTILADPNGRHKGRYSTVSMRFCDRLRVIMILTDNAGTCFKVYNTSKSALNAITVILAMKNPDIHVVSINPGHNATNLNRFSGPMDPKDGAMVTVDHVLKKIGKSPSYWSADEELPW